MIQTELSQIVSLSIDPFSAIKKGYSIPADNNNFTIICSFGGMVLKMVDAQFCFVILRDFYFKWIISKE